MFLYGFRLNDSGVSHTESGSILSSRVPGIALRTDCCKLVKAMRCTIVYLCTTLCTTPTTSSCFPAREDLRPDQMIETQCGIRGSIGTAELSDETASTPGLHVSTHVDQVCIVSGPP